MSFLNVYKQEMQLPLPPPPKAEHRGQIGVEGRSGDGARIYQSKRSSIAYQLPQLLELPIKVR